MLCLIAKTGQPWSKLVEPGPALPQKRQSLSKAEWVAQPEPRHPGLMLFQKREALQMIEMYSPLGAQLAPPLERCSERLTQRSPLPAWDPADLSACWQMSRSNLLHAAAACVQVVPAPQRV